MLCCGVPEGRKHLCELPDGPQAPLKGGAPAAVLLLLLSASVLCDYCLSEMSDDTKFYAACFPDREQNGGWPKRPLFRAYFLLQTRKELFLGAASRLRV